MRFLGTFFPAFLAVSFSQFQVEGSICAEKVALQQVASWNWSQRILVVVDGFSDGSRYAPEAARLFPDVKRIHIQSTATPPSGLKDSFQKETYDLSITAPHHDLREIVSAFKPFEVVRVVAGTETGVKLADQLSESLDTLGNGTSLSETRTDKGLLANAMAPLLQGQDDIQLIPGHAFSDGRDALEYIQSRNLSYPLVIKPTSSAGNFGFHIAHSSADVRLIFNTWLGEPDPLGKTIHSLLVQPKLEGDVLAINTVSHPSVGQVATDFWRTKVRFTQNNIVFLRTQIFAYRSENPEHQKMLLAAQYAAKGLGVDFGPLHPEFLQTRDGKLYMMDVGARPAGGSLTRIAKSCGAFDQIEMTLLAAFDPSEFDRRAALGPQLLEAGAFIYFVSPVSGIVQKVPSFEEMRARIPGFYTADLSHMKVGARLEVSSSLFDQPGFVFVKGDEVTINSAERAIRKWESEDFYQVDSDEAIRR